MPRAGYAESVAAACRGARGVSKEAFTRTPPFRRLTRRAPSWSHLTGYASTPALVPPCGLVIRRGRERPNALLAGVGRRSHPGPVRRVRQHPRNATTSHRRDDRALPSRATCSLDGHTFGLARLHLLRRLSTDPRFEYGRRRRPRSGCVTWSQRVRGRRGFFTGGGRRTASSRRSAPGCANRLRLHGLRLGNRGVSRTRTHDLRTGPDRDPSRSRSSMRRWRRVQRSGSARRR